MHTDAQVRKPGGRLSREDQRRIGDILQRVYDEVLPRRTARRRRQPSGKARDTTKLIVWLGPRHSTTRGRDHDDAIIRS